jgi:hypothetical protein
MTLKRRILPWVMILCVVLCFNISKAENSETILRIIAEENIINLMDACGVKAAVIENTEGLRCIRVARNTPDGSWILQSSPWMALPIWLNDVHSNDEWIELEYDLAEEELFVSFCLFPDEDGSWYLGELDGCLLRQDVPYIVEVIDFHPDNNDDFHYGSLRISLALEDVNLELLPPYTGVFNTILDPDGWACVHVEGAILYDAPDGEPIAACPLRVAGTVIEQTDGWTCLQIGSPETGLQGWYHTEDLFFGEETEYVVCSFPSYNWDVFEHLDSVFPDADIETDESSTRLWLIGRCPDGRWLVQINVDTVAFADAAAFTDIGPTEHDWYE